MDTDTPLNRDFLRVQLRESPAAVEQKLRNAIIQDPDNDALRLLYADILRDHIGVDRSDFIRLQINLFELAPKERAESENRQKVRRMRELSVRMPGSDVEGVFDHIYHRGFVGLVSVATDPTNAFETIRHCRRIEPVQHVDICDRFPSPPHTTEWHALDGLRSISLERNMNDDLLKEFIETADLTELQWLSLAYSPVGYDGVAALAMAQDRLPKLRWVNLRATEFPANERYEYDPDTGVVYRPVPHKNLKQIEDQFGYLPWLHVPDVQTLHDTVPSRYRTPPAQSSSPSSNPRLEPLKT